MSGSSDPLIAAFYAATGRPRTPYSSKRSQKEISDDVSTTFDFSRKSGLAAFPLNKTLELTYRDEFDDLTYRVVDVRGVFAFNGKRYFEGYCHLRGEYRTFLYERVVKAFDGGLLVFSQHPVMNGLSDALDVDLSISQLALTDFFVHPRTWGDYRRAVAVLVSAWREKQFEELACFEKIANFVKVSFASNPWSNWRTEQQAYAVCLLGLTVETLFLNHRDEYRQVRGGRFNRTAFEASWNEANS